MTALKAKIYTLDSGQYQLSYRNPVDGKRKRHKFASEKDARAWSANLERQVHTKNLGFFVDVYVGNLIEQHLKACPESRFMERQNVFRSFCAEFAAVKLSAISKAALKAWFAKIKAEQNYSERTLNSIKSQVNYLFRYLVEEGYLAQSPLDQIKFKRVVPPRRPRIILSVDEVRAVLTDAESFSPDMLFVYLSCVAHTGARRSEILRLNREDIDFGTGLIQIKKSKNGRERFVRMSPALFGILKNHLAAHDHQPVLSDKNGKRFTASELSRLMKKFKAFFPIDKAGWGSHSLRHSFAYNFLKKGGQMYQLQAILGHRSIDVTVDLYGQLQAQDVACPSPYEPEEE